MKKQINYSFMILSVIFFTGCGTTSPNLQSQIATCSRETNAYSVGQRLGNGAYWSCLDREENKDRYRAQQQQQQAKSEMFRNSCLSFGFQTGTSAFANCMMTQQQQDNINAQNQAVIELQRQRQAQQQINDGIRMLSPQNNSINCYHAPGSPITSCQ
jgi:hypothetical protein